MSTALETLRRIIDQTTHKDEHHALHDSLGLEGMLEIERQTVEK